MELLLERLRATDRETFLHAIREACDIGQQGDAALAEVLDTLSEGRRFFVVMALGDASGEAGPGALRTLLRHGNAPPHALGYAVVALAKRCGTAATEDFVAALETEDLMVQGLAFVSLAGAGDDRAWDRVFELLEEHLQHPTRRIENPFVHDIDALCYLACHAGAAGSPRITRLVGLIRGHWSKLDRPEHEWVERRWPESGPGGPAEASVVPPDAEAIMEEARHPYFDSAFDVILE